MIQECTAGRPTTMVRVRDKMTTLVNIASPVVQKKVPKINLQCY
jgi:hypothetical protein